MSKNREIIDRIKTVTATREITQAMKMIACTKVGRIKRALDLLTQYDGELAQLRLQVSMQQPSYLFHHPYYQPANSADHKLLILIMSDRGLCGPFNQYIFNRFLGAYRAYQQKGFSNYVLPIGRLAITYLQRFAIKNQLKDYVHLGQATTEAEVAPLVKLLVTEFLQGHYQELVLIYQAEPKALQETVIVERFLPLSTITTKLDEKKFPLQTIYEKDVESILAYLLERQVELKLLQAILQSQYAENRMRMLAMSQATDNADELLKKLKLERNRSRQNEITRKIIEIAVGAEALRFQ